MFNRQFWLGMLVGLMLGAILRQRRISGVTQERLSAYYKRRARIYNLTDYLYLGQFPRITMRRTLLDMMDLRPGMRVLDYACGAGANFPYIIERIGLTGQLVGVDYSQEMLDAAHAQFVIGKGWKNISLVRSDAADMRFDEPFDAVLVTLGLAVIPRWQEALERGWALVKPGGVYGVADLSESTRWYTLPIRWLTDLIDIAIIADSSRRPWEWMATQGVDYQRREIFHGYFYAATIRKPITP